MIHSLFSYYKVLLNQQFPGPLQSVSNVNRSGTILSWVPPFSLDLTGIDPDIIYCVEVYNITCGRRDLIVSDCNVTEPSYTSDDIAPHGYIYEYSVTPRSNVEGAKNGTSVTVSGMVTSIVLVPVLRTHDLAVLSFKCVCLVQETICLM